MTDTALGTGLAFWTDADGDWDTLVLGGTVWPGIWEISGDGVKRDIDLKKEKGSDKATLKDEGYKNAKIEAVGTIWTLAQWRELQQILPEVHPRRDGGDRQALQIIHPGANLLGIDSVYLTGIKVPSLDKAKGGPLQVTLSLIEWTPTPKPVKEASGTGGGAGGANTYCTEYQQTLQWLNSTQASYSEIAASAEANPDDEGLAAAQQAMLAQVVAAQNALLLVQCPPRQGKSTSELSEEDLSGEADAGLGDGGETPANTANDLSGFA